MSARQIKRPLRAPRRVRKLMPEGGTAPSELVAKGRGNRLGARVAMLMGGRPSAQPPAEQQVPKDEWFGITQPPAKLPLSEQGVTEAPVKGQNPLGDLVEKYGEERVREGVNKLLADASVEWISTKEKAAEIGRGVTYVKDHAEELGGRKKGTRWYFPKGEA